MDVRTLLVRCSAAVLIAAAPLVAHADADSERESLTKISQELQQLRVMVAEAEKNADQTARVKFRYDWLEKDIDLVKAGVDDHLDAPRQPRPVEPLRGDYRR